jgi:non-specific serine/threonine protein kinase
MPVIKDAGAEDLRAAKPEPHMPRLGLRLTPHGSLLLETPEDGPFLDDKVAQRLADAFALGSGRGLLQLGGGEVGQALPPVFVWWRDFGGRYVGSLCHRGDGGAGDAAGSLVVPAPTDGELAFLLLTAPLMPGAEYLSADMLIALWNAMAAALAASLAETGADLQSFLKRLNPAWNLLGRVHFNLAENKRDPDRPFAFMATYTTQLSAQAKVQHAPLGQALRDYAGAANREKLLSLLKPMQRAAESCDWLKAMVGAGDIFHPLRWGPAEAARFLASAAELEAAGVILRMPATWRGNRPARPQVKATVGTQPPSAIGLDGILDFDMQVTLDGAPLTQAEIDALLAGTDGLVLMRGQWVEIDRTRLDETLRRFHEAQILADRDGLTFVEAMRLLAGAAIGDDERAIDSDWSAVTAGPWLAETLRALRAPGISATDPGAALNGTLRPYQKAGVEWLRLLSSLGLGACLADDMGLGKTIQILALLLSMRERAPAGAPPSLLVAPASLLANWEAEIGRFAPSLKVTIVHPSALPPDELKALTPARLADADLAITTYGSLLRLPVLRETRWGFLVLDEAQAIKNPNAKQTKAVKALRAQARIALTGTPVENHLGDLWSIFDAINPGLLGTAKEFTRYTKGLAERTHNPYGPLRDLVRPYILRRMKTDKTVIADLPDKTEVTAHCTLSRKQAALYAETVADLAEALEAADGMARRGVVLATLIAMVERQPVGRGGQRQMGAAAGDRRNRGGASGKDAGLHAVPGDHRAVAGLSRRHLRPVGPGAARRDRGAQPPVPGPQIPGGRDRPLLHPVAEGRRFGPDPDRRLSCRACRSLVESRRRESGDRPRLPHRPKKECPGA